jgi:hypothetical protein
MGKHKTLPDDFLDHLCEDYGLETLLEMNDIEPTMVLKLLITEGYIDLEDLYLELDSDDDE